MHFDRKLIVSLLFRAKTVSEHLRMTGQYRISLPFQAKTVSENLRMSSALLSRFDLIFILLDKPNEEMDQVHMAIDEAFYVISYALGR